MAQEGKFFAMSVTFGVRRNQRMINWDKFRREDRSIDLLEIALAKYPKLSEESQLFIMSLEGYSLISSRQVAAFVLAVVDLTEKE